MNSIPGLPRIVRARDFHLYDDRGNRYLDMYLNGGRALLGHRPANVARELGAALSRGLFAEYPSIYTSRIERLLANPASAAWTEAEGRTGRVFRSHESALIAAARYLGADPRALVPADSSLPGVAGADPASGSRREARVVLLHPFAARRAELAAADVVMPVIPFPGAWGPAVLLFPAAGPGRRPVPDSDAVAAAPLSALIRAINNLRATRVWPGEAPSSARIAPIWAENGPYLHARCAESDYPELYRRFLERRILLNPQFPGPSILPIIWSEGERTLFLRVSESVAKELPFGEF